MGLLDFLKRKKEKNVVIKPVLKIDADAEAKLSIGSKKRKPVKKAGSRRKPKRSGRSKRSRKRR
jgi:hypothetical protein